MCESEDFFSLTSIYQGKDLIRIIAIKILNHYNWGRFPLLIWNDRNMKLCLLVPNSRLNYCIVHLRVS